MTYKTYRSATGSIMSAESKKYEANVYVQLDMFARDPDSSSVILRGTSLNLPLSSLVACHYHNAAVIQMMCGGK